MSAGNAFDVFRSYHWRDHARVEAVARWLRDQGLRYSSIDGIWWPGAPGPRRWSRRSAPAAPPPCSWGPEMGPWQQREKNLALERQVRDAEFPVIPVLLPQADPVLGFLGQNIWIGLREQPGDPSRLALLAAAIWGVPLGPDIRETLNAMLATLSPYRYRSFSSQGFARHVRHYG